MLLCQRLVKSPLFLCVTTVFLTLLCASSIFAANNSLSTVAATAFEGSSGPIKTVECVEGNVSHDHEIGMMRARGFHHAKEVK